jgi:hypothetical protein
MSDEETCPKCNEPIQWTDRHCLVCKHDLGVPNQRELDRQYEIEALKQRHHNVVTQVENDDLKFTLENFEQQIASNSRAIINIPTKLLDDLLSRDSMLMSNYTLQVNAKMRSPAKQEDDQRRKGTEGTLFGSYAHEIIYAALSAGPQGVGFLR